MHAALQAVAAVAYLAVPSVVAAAEWEPKQAPIMTWWADDVSAQTPLPEYPRPQLVRDGWTNLNGLWDYAVTDGSRPNAWAGQILVPFAIESALSGVMQRVRPEQTLWYRRTIDADHLASAGDGERTLLHFGAVDWHARVFVNGVAVGEHKGGYDPFRFDITDVLRDGENELVVAVTDPTDTASVAAGKQHVEPRGIWYTPVTGIWQTVWLERVSASHITAVKIETDIDAKRVTVAVTGEALDGATLRVMANGREWEAPADRPLTFEVPDAELWSPDSPTLYDLMVELLRDDKVVDTVKTYFALRKVEVKADAHGHNRIHLNGEPIFSFGLLDQGWWPDGLYTAPTDEALRYDLGMTRAWGFNTVRKHVKVEPARWYWHCDRMGLLVWQDMPSVRHPSPDWVRDLRAEPLDGDMAPDDAAQFREELTQLVTEFGHFPSIIMWVPFNEAWGQHDTVATAEHVKALDPTRLVNAASGGNFVPAGDVLDVHNYPDPVLPPAREGQIAVCGEFGGLGLPIEGHTWSPKENWGYRTFETQDELAAAYERKVSMLPLLISQGLAAAIYTQTTDVEPEVNGLMTYDRAVVKVSPQLASTLAAATYAPPAEFTAVVPDARTEAHAWRYTVEPPPVDWASPDFDDGDWATGAAGFGSGQTHAATTRTDWSTDAIWIRRTFDLSDVGGDYVLTLNHDEDVAVFINGVPAYAADGFRTEYGIYPISDAARAALREGQNTLAITCRQTRGGQYIDAGLLSVQPAE